MLIDLINANFINKGSLLMIHAISQYIEGHYPDSKLAVDLRISEGDRNKEIKLYKILRRDFYTLPVQINPLLQITASLLPEKYRRSHHIVLEKETDVIFDAAGFTYSDQGIENLLKIMAQHYSRWKSLDKKIILLPQAFGPFTDPKISFHMKRIIDCADLIYARDLTSYNHLVALLGEKQPKIKCAPDFTNLVEGKLPSYFAPFAERPCIIPNFRMIDKTQPEISEKYIPIITSCISYLLEQGLEPFFIIHESSRDEEIAHIVQNRLGTKFAIIREPDPIYIKGLLANCSFVIGSRYHGLVSSLSQGTPAVGTSWSHKYEALFEDYHCSNNLLTMNESHDDLKIILDQMIDSNSRKEIKDRLLVASEEQKSLSRQMWKEVFQFVRGN